jgi:hypothetical protein
LAAVDLIIPEALQRFRALLSPQKNGNIPVNRWASPSQFAAFITANSIATATRPPGGRRSASIPCRSRSAFGTPIRTSLADHTFPTRLLYLLFGGVRDCPVCTSGRADRSSPHRYRRCTSGTHTGIRLGFCDRLQVLIRRGEQKKPTTVPSRRRALLRPRDQTLKH